MTVHVSEPSSMRFIVEQVDVHVELDVELINTHEEFTMEQIEVHARFVVAMVDVHEFSLGQMCNFGSRQI